MLVGRVVLHVQHHTLDVAGPRGSDPGCVAIRGQLIGVRGSVEGDREATALAESGFDGDGGAHRVTEAFGQSEAEAGSLDPGSLRAETVIGREDAIEHLGCDPAAGIGDRDRDRRRHGIGFGAHGDGTPGAVELDRVRQQVDEHLAQTLTVRSDDGARGLGHLDGNAGIAGLGCHQHQGVIHGAGHRYRVE